MFYVPYKITAIQSNSDVHSNRVFYTKVVRCGDSRILTTVIMPCIQFIPLCSLSAALHQSTASKGGPGSIVVRSSVSAALYECVDYGMQMRAQQLLNRASSRGQ